MVGVLRLLVAISLLVIFGGCELKPRYLPVANRSPRSPAPPEAITSSVRLERARTSIRIKDFETAKAQLSFISSNDPEYIEAQKLKRVIEQGSKEEERKRRDAERQRIPQLREELRLEYERFITDANPHLNFIGSKVTKTKGGYALWATHEFFSEYTFASGNDAKLVQDWIVHNEARLNDASIVRVGVMGRGSFASWSYFDVP